jgi:hypothetical protein
MKNRLEGDIVIPSEPRESRYQSRMRTSTKRLYRWHGTA